jgi:hypothetical protein
MRQGLNLQPLLYFLFILEGLDQSHREHLYPLYFIVPVFCFSTLAITRDWQVGQCFAISS